MEEKIERGELSVAYQYIEKEIEVEKERISQELKIATDRQFVKENIKKLLVKLDELNKLL